MTEFTKSALIEAGKEARVYRAFARVFQIALAACALTASGSVLAEPLRVIAFGDSLTAGYLLPADASFPAQLEKRLRADGYDVRVVNAGVSGETAADGLARLAFTLGDKADLVIVELGANDMLRGLDTGATRETLDKIVVETKAKSKATLLAGMIASTNFGADYKKRFDAIYPELAARHSVPLYPFFLAGVAGDASLLLADGLHPNAAGVARIVSGVAPLVEKSLVPQRAAGAGGGESR